MTLTERLFTLRTLPPFNGLREGELAVIVGSAVERVYQPGQLVASAGKPLRALFVILSGALAGPDGCELPHVYGYASLVTGSQLKQAVRAAPGTGATCLLISQGYFFTLLHECPGLAVGLLGMECEAIEAVNEAVQS